MIVEGYQVVRLQARTNHVSRLAGGITGPRPGGGWGPLTSGDGGDAAAAGVGWPSSVAVDSAGNVYVAQFGESDTDHRIRRIDGKTNVISAVLTFAGPGARIVDGLAVDRDQGLLFTNRDGRVFRLDWATNRSGPLGEGLSWMPGRERSGLLDWPSSLAVDASGNVYVGKPGLVARIELVSGKVVLMAKAGVDKAARSVEGKEALVASDVRVCGDPSKSAILVASVTDAIGGSLPGAVLRVFPGNAASAEAIDTRQAGATGRTTLQAREGGEYVLLVTMPSFVPLARAISLEEGCTVYTSAALTVGPNVGGDYFPPDR